MGVIRERKDDAVASDGDIIRHAGAFAENADAGIEVFRIDVVGGILAADADLTAFAKDHVFVGDDIFNHGVFANHAIVHDDGIAHDRAFLDDDARRKNALFHDAVHDAASRQHGVRNAGVRQNLGRRTIRDIPFFQVRVHVPFGKIEAGCRIQHIHIGIEERLHRADISPIPFEDVVENAILLNHFRNDVAAEIVLASGVFGVRHQFAN